MPYLPTNYYPKNCGIAVKNESKPVALYCLVDQYDTIERAIISIYGYLDKKLKYKIYADNQGKIIKEITFNEKGEVNSDLSDEDLKNWHNGYIENTSPWYNQNGNQVIDWSIDENIFPIIGGKSENSIIYIELPKDLLNENKKYLWDIEVFSKDSNVWIVDGELDDNWNEIEGNFVKIYPNDNINVGNIFHTEIDDFQIISVENKYWDVTSKATVTENSTVNDGETIQNLLYKNYYNFTDNNNTVLPSNLNDIKVQIEVYTFDYYDDENVKPSKISEGSDGYILKNKIFTAKELFTPSSNIYLYYYRQYQTLGLDSIENLETGINYTIYSNGIKSTPNYFITLIEPELKLYTYNLNEKIYIKDGDILTLSNSFHQFFNENQEDNPSIAWYQWTIFEKDVQKYQSEKIYSSTIYLEYPEFLQTNYDINFKIQYQNGYEQEKNFSLIINHDTPANTVLKSMVDFDRKAIKIDYTDINSYTPIIKGTPGDLVEKDEKYYLLIPDGGSYEYTTLGSSQEALDINTNWNFSCRFTEGFYGDIFSMIIDEQEYKLFYDGETDEFDFNGERFSPYTGVSSGYLFSPGNNISNALSGNQTIVAASTSIVGFSFLDLLSNLTLTASYNKENKTLTFTCVNKELPNEKYEYIIENLSFQYGNLTSIKFFSKIYWDSFYLEDTLDSKKYQFSIIFSSGNFNGGDFVTPQGFINYKYYVYRYNLSKDKELLDYIHVCDLPLISDNVILGFYDYGIGGDNRYEYIIVPVYKQSDADIYFAGAMVRSEPVQTDWFEISVFSTKEEKDNMYLIDTNQKWYFELDASGNQITYNSDVKIHNLNTALPKIGLSNKNYLSNNITCKLGKIKNEFEYVEDNIKYLDDFSKMSNNNKVKILRLKNGLIIPVNITLKTAAFNNNLIGTPTDISFDWIQIADYKNVSLYEYLYKEGEK